MSEWVEYLLEDVISHFIDYRGKTPNKTDFGIPLITAKIVKSGKILEPNEFISPDDYLDWMTRGFPEIDDVVITTEAPLGEIALIKDKNVALAQRIITLRGHRERVFNPFLKYYFQNEAGQHELQSRASGTTVFGIKASVLKKVPIVLPPLPEQKAIAAVLSSLDDKIDLLYRQNKTLEAMSETLFRQWFIDKEIIGTVAQLIKIQNGFAFKSKDFREIGSNSVLKIKNISGGVIDIFNTDYIDDNIAEATQLRFKVCAGDILIGMTGAEIGKLGVVPNTSKSLWLNQRVGLLIDKFRGAKYLAYLQLKSDYGQDYIENTATGSAQPNISGDGIEGCGFPLLSKEEIESYSFQIEYFYEKITFNLGQIQTLEKLRDNLLPKLMSGEVRVSYEQQDAA